MNWWYYLKKRFSLFPGFRTPVSAPFLFDYYQRRRAERSAARVALDGLVYLLFQLWAPLRARSIASRHGLSADWARKAAGIARRRFADPNDIAVFSIAEDRDLDRYMRRFEYAEISKRINPAAWASNCALADKERFADRCRDHGLLHPKLLAVVRAGRVEIREAPDGPAIAVKPAAGLGGHGFGLLEYPDWQRRDMDGFRAFLEQHLRDRRGSWIVQAKCEGHPDFRDIALNALSTARVTTMRGESGAPEIVTSVLRFAGRTDSLVDNLANGGLLAPIDPVTGEVGPACYGRKPGDIDVHPVTGAAIAGSIVPDWNALVALVKRAHEEAFPEYSMVGWDVGIAAGGPVLIEGNGKPGLFAAQRATREGIGATRFGQLITHHLARAGAPNGLR